MQSPACIGLQANNDLQFKDMDEKKNCKIIEIFETYKLPAMN